jgi:hypothetical protein
MLCLSDSDLVIKLAEFDLLDATFAMLKVPRANVRVLAELPNVLRGVRIYSKHTRDGIQRALDFVKGIKTLDKIDRHEHILLQSVSATYRGRPIKIDGGEAILYGATKFLQDFIVATGDKRSLRALASDVRCQDICNRLRGRVLCLENLLLKLIEAEGFTFVQKRVAPMCSCDDCVEEAFAGGKPNMPECETRKWLTSFVDELQQETNGLLAA